MSAVPLHFPETVEVMVRDALAAGHSAAEVGTVVKRVLAESPNGALPVIRGWTVTFDSNVFTASRGSVTVRATTEAGLRTAVASLRR